MKVRAAASMGKLTAKKLLYGMVAISAAIFVTLCIVVPMHHADDATSLQKTATCDTGCHGHNQTVSDARSVKREDKKEPLPLPDTQIVIPVFIYLTAIPAAFYLWRNNHKYLLHQQLRF